MARVIGILISCLLAGFALLGVRPAQAVVVQGTFTYQDPKSPNPIPIRYAKVEIWHIGTGLFDVWAHVASTTTDANGFMSVNDFATEGTYGVRVFAVNHAATVWPNDAVHVLPFHREPGEPGPVVHGVPRSSDDVLDFSWRFSSHQLPGTEGKSGTRIDHAESYIQSKSP